LDPHKYAYAIPSVSKKNEEEFISYQILLLIEKREGEKPKSSSAEQRKHE
jgi:hypothetical protein